MKNNAWWPGMVAFALLISFLFTRDLVQGAEQRGYDRGYGRAKAEDRADMQIANGTIYTVPRKNLGLRVMDNGEMNIVAFVQPSGYESLATFRPDTYTINEGMPRKAKGFVVHETGQWRRVSEGRDIYLVDHSDQSGTMAVGEYDAIAKIISLTAKKPHLVYSDVAPIKIVSGIGCDKFHGWVTSSRCQAAIFDRIQ